MKKVIRLTESDLTKIVRKIIKESESLESTDILSQFTNEELMVIKDNVIRYLQPGFFDDWEAASYLRHEVANNDEDLYKALIDWLGKNGVKFESYNL